MTTPERPDRRVIHVLTQLTSIKRIMLTTVVSTMIRNKDDNDDHHDDVCSNNDEDDNDDLVINLQLEHEGRRCLISPHPCPLPNRGFTLYIVQNLL